MTTKLRMPSLLLSLAFALFLTIIGSYATRYENNVVNEALFIDMPVDHFGNGSSRSYKNRYWMNATYYEAGGPVFLFDAGEQDAEPLLSYYLQEYHGLSAVMRLAKRYNGLAVLWEHRFYGASLPFPITENTTSEQWNFLTTEQGLDDVVFFANSFSSTSNMTHKALHPSVTPWIWLGPSYPGTRGAILRSRNPEVIFAVWASSAPPQAQVNMPSYFETIERSLTRNCSADWVAVTKYVDEVLSGTNATLKTDIKFALKKALLSKPGGDTKDTRGLTRDKAAEISNVDTGSMLLKPSFHFQYYGFQAYILPFCDLLETRNFTDRPIDSGIAAVSGDQSAFDAFVVALAESDSDAEPNAPFDKPWMWQYCSEYGYFLTGNPANMRSIATTFRSQEWFQESCYSSFPEGALPPAPVVDKVIKYGGWNINPPNVFFTNGEFDPWRTLSLASVEPNAPHRQPTMIVPECGVPPPNHTFFGLTHQGMVHSSDMRVLLTPDANHRNFKTIGYHSPISPEPFYAALGLFQRALDQWLPCFVPGALSGGDAMDYLSLKNTVCSQDQHPFPSQVPGNTHWDICDIEALAGR